MCLPSLVKSTHWPEEGQQEASPSHLAVLLFIPVTYTVATPLSLSLLSHSLLCFLLLPTGRQRTSQYYETIVLWLSSVIQHESNIKNGLIWHNDGLMYHNCVEQCIACLNDRLLSGLHIRMNIQRLTAHNR